MQPNNVKIYPILKTPIDVLILNPTNPRKISEEKFQRLVASVKRVPWMLELRPIVANRDGVILGGNQRYKACVEAGMDFVWCIWADEITDEQAKRFILRDNIDFGKWDLEIMRRHYSQDELLKYGSEIVLIEKEIPVHENSQNTYVPLGDDEFEPSISDEEMDESKKKFNETSIKQIVFHLPNDIYEDTLKSMDQISKELDLDDNSEVLLHLLYYYEVGNGISKT